MLIGLEQISFDAEGSCGALIAGQGPDAGPRVLPGAPEVIGRLHLQPRLCGAAQGSGQADGEFSAHGRVPVHDPGQRYSGHPRGGVGCAYGSWSGPSVIVLVVHQFGIGADELEGQPPVLVHPLGRPVTTVEAMPAIGGNAHPILIGDFHQGYELVDIHGLSITRDDVTTPGLTKFYIRARLGGCMLDNNAIKVVKWAAA